MKHPKASGITAHAGHIHAKARLFQTGLFFYHSEFWCEGVRTGGKPLSQTTRRTFSAPEGVLNFLEPVVHTQVTHNTVTLASITCHSKVDVQRGGLGRCEPYTEFTHC